MNGSRLSMLFKKIFGKFQQPHWETTISSSGMIRVCPQTGQKEFRDSKHKKWIPFKDDMDLLKLRREVLDLEFSSERTVWKQKFSSS